MTKRNQIYAYIREHPGVTNYEIAAALDMKPSTVASQTTQMIQRGVLTRQKVGSTLSNVARYAFFAPLTEEIVPSAKKPKSTMDDMVASFVDQFANTLVTALVETLKPRIEAKLREALPAALPKINPPAPKQEVLPSKKKVLVVGLLPQQAGMIASEFGEVFDLNFADKDALNGKLKTQVLHSDLVVGMVGFISHAQDDILQMAGGYYRKCSGGMTRLRDLLTQEYVG